MLGSSFTEKTEDAGEVHYETGSITYADKPAAGLEALEDNHRWDWFTIRTLITSGTGFFTDAYDVFVINLISPMLGILYYPQYGGHIPAGTEGVLKGMSSVGTLVGQLVFGYLGDAKGRQKIYGLELMIIIIGTLCCAMSGSNIKGASAIDYLCFWRFVLGVGIGGDYPMSATVTSEWAAAGRRGQMMSLIFSMQGVGNMAASIVTLVVLKIFETAIKSDTDNLDIVWRICVGVGCIPAVSTVYLRLTMPESPRYAMDVEKNPAKANDAISQAIAQGGQADQLNEIQIVDNDGTAPRRSQSKEFLEYFSYWENCKILIGTASTWFLLDIAFYGISLNQSFVISAMGFTGDGTVFSNLWRSTIGNLIVSCLGAVPGYFITVLTIEKMGRKTIQLMGFAVVTVLFIIMASAFHALQQNTGVFIFVFALSQLFMNFGPNSTTFVIPGEVFPTRVRATAHGISAASGKAGAILTTFAFPKLVDLGGPPGAHAFMNKMFAIFAGIMALGFILTFLIPETKGMTLEEIEERGLRKAGHQE
ncbi:Inorganic phosphate transporter pho84 [Entomortierella chlamydospora]|nr:Inorganic phosphate transporter pho84 [Entomortierella chlamydospora]